MLSKDVQSCFYTNTIYYEQTTNHKLRTFVIINNVHLL